MAARSLRPARALALTGLLLVAAALVAAGCGVGPGTPPGGVKLIVTREFGAKTIKPLSNAKVGGAETVMSLLIRNAKITTRYGGGFVQSIDGVSGGEERGKPVDWFYYVNGVEAEKGATEVEVQQGDEIWWDMHNWSQAERTPAVVGSFPEPFLNGLEGKRLPVRVECVDPQAGPCKQVVGALTKLGIPSAFSAIGPVGESQDTLQLLVGTYSELKRVPAAQLLEKGPGGSGVYMRVLGGGRSFALLTADGGAARTVTSGGGLIAATRYWSEAPTWIVTGTDAAGVAAAAAHFDAASLHRRFAIAVVPRTANGSGGGEVLPLPISGG